MHHCVGKKSPPLFVSVYDVCIKQKFVKQFAVAEGGNGKQATGCYYNVGDYALALAEHRSKIKTLVLDFSNLMVHLFS